jgi:hypothetical protein
MTKSSAFTTLFHKWTEEDTHDIQRMCNKVPVEEDSEDDESKASKKKGDRAADPADSGDDKPDPDSSDRELPLLKEGARFEPHMDKKRWSEPIKDEYRIGDVLFVNSGKARVSHVVGRQANGSRVLC